MTESVFGFPETQGPRNLVSEALATKALVSEACAHESSHPGASCAGVSSIVRLKSEFQEDRGCGPGACVPKILDPRGILISHSRGARRRRALRVCSRIEGQTAYWFPRSRFPIQQPYALELQSHQNEGSAPRAHSPRTSICGYRAKTSLRQNPATMHGIVSR
mgnify:CR=1 FL=1